jgi:hypothetical protein
MAEQTMSEARSWPPRAVAALAMLLVLGGAAACSSTGTKTEVKGAVITREDPNLGGPDPALAEFRAGERSTYGGGPTALG